MFRFFLIRQASDVREDIWRFLLYKVFYFVLLLIIRLCDKIALNRLEMPLLLTFKQKWDTCKWISVFIVLFVLSLH